MSAKNVGPFAYINNFRFEAPTTPLNTVEWPLATMVVFLACVAGLRWIMRGRDPIQLRLMNRVHNAILCLWSLSMFIGIIASVAPYIYRYRSFSAALYDYKGEIWNDGRFQFWCYQYYVSKYYELLDTMFLVLKKKPLSFLHVYHHSIMLFAPWASMHARFTLQWYGFLFNTIVHVLMYYYYVVVSFGIKPWWKVYLTQMQIVQFLTSMVAIFSWFYVCVDRTGADSIMVWFNGETLCAGELKVVWLCQLVTLSFLALFINFFVQNYIFRKPAKKDKKNIGEKEALKKEE